MTSTPGPGLASPADPEHDPTATYAVDPALARRLARRVAAAGGATHTGTAPFTAQPIAAVPLSGADDVRAAAARARQAQQSWVRVPLELRADILLRYHDLVLDRQEEILDLIQWESGKARKHAFEEVAYVAMAARYYARTAARAVGPRRLPGIFPVLTRVDLRRVPKGVIGLITPWNYPFAMAIGDGLAAVVAGNVVLHKPDLQTPLSTLYGLELLGRAGLPVELWQVVLGPGAEIGPEVVDHVDHVCFTGSTRTGREVAVRAAGRLIGASLELGGKNPMLVLRDADLDRAAEIAARACFASAGQLCVSTERLYVADQVYDRFVQRFLRRIEALELTASLDYRGDVGSLVSPAQLDTVTRHVEDARAKGAAVLAGGRARPDVGPLFYEPTVLEGVRPDMECFGTETFGPVVSLYRFVDEQEAVDRANTGRFGLNAAIVTRDAARGRRLAARIRCGTVNVNEAYGATFGSLDAPMGGMGDSGLGRRQGIEGIQRFTEAQAIGTQRLLPIAPTLGISDARYAAMMTTSLRVLKRLRRR